MLKTVVNLNLGAHSKCAVYMSRKCNKNRIKTGISNILTGKCYILEKQEYISRICCLRDLCQTLNIDIFGILTENLGACTLPLTTMTMALAYILMYVLCVHVLSFMNCYI